MPLQYILKIHRYYSWYQKRAITISYLFETCKNVPFHGFVNISWPNYPCLFPSSQLSVHDPDAEQGHPSGTWSTPPCAGGGAPPTCWDRRWRQQPQIERRLPNALLRSRRRPVPLATRRPPTPTPNLAATGRALLRPLCLLSLSLSPPPLSLVSLL